MLTIKGIAIIKAFQVLREFGEPEFLQAIHQAMPEDAGKLIFGQTITADAQVSYAAFLQILVSGAHVVNQPVPLFMEDINEKITALEFNSILSFFVKILYPQVFLKRLPLIWRKYFEQGILLIDFPEKNHCICTNSGIASLPEYHDIDLMSSTAAMLRRCNAHNIQITHTQCVNKGDKDCVYHITWE